MFPPYGSTAVRPAWPDLPAPLRAAIEARLGAEVAAATTAGGGFTSGFAAVVSTSAGHRAFVKAAPAGTPQAGWYAREAAITAALPTGVPAPRLRWADTAAGHVILCLDAVDGDVPALPWRPADLTAALTAWADAAELLRDPPPALLAVGVPALADLARDALSWWTEIAAGREPLPDLSRDTPHQLTHAAAGRPPLPRLPDDRLAAVARTRVGELGALERKLWSYRDDRVTHGDLRVDNIVLDGAGKAWLCDWTWPCRGPAWFDTASLLVTARASGLDADALFAAHPTAAGAPPNALDAALAALSGHWLVQAAAPHSAGAGLHHAFSGREALAWLAARRGWE